MDADSPCLNEVAREVWDDQSDVPDLRNHRIRAVNVALAYELTRMGVNVGGDPYAVLAAALPELAVRSRPKCDPMK